MANKFFISMIIFTKLTFLIAFLNRSDRAWKFKMMDQISYNKERCIHHNKYAILIFNF